MDRAEVLEKVKTVVAKVLNMDAGGIEDDARFIEDLGAESIQSVELMAAFEEEFDIELDEDRSQECKTIALATNYITEVLNEG